MTEIVHAGCDTPATFTPMRLRAQSLPLLILAVIALSAALVAPGSPGHDELGGSETAVEAAAAHAQSKGRVPARDERDWRDLRRVLDALRWSCVVLVALVLGGRLWSVRKRAPAHASSLLEHCRGRSPAAPRPPRRRLRRESVTTPAAAALVQRCREVAPDGSASLPVAGSDWRQDDVREAFEEPWEPEPIEVHILAWPEDEEQRRKLADERMPRLLRIEAGASPPELWDELEDWYREGSSTADVLARRDTVQVRASRRAREPVLDGSVLRVGQQWVAIPPARVPVVALLLSPPGRGRAPGRARRRRRRRGRQLGRDRGASRAPPLGQGLGHRRPAAAQRAGSGLAARGAAGLTGPGRASRAAPDAAKKKERCRSGFSGPWRRRAGDETRTKHLGSNLTRVFPTDKELMWRSIPGTQPGC